MKSSYFLRHFSHFNSTLQTLNDGMKAMSAGLGKMQAVGWAVGSAVADASKKAAKSTGEAAKSVGESAKSVDTSNIQKSAGEGWATASAKATAGWGWLSRYPFCFFSHRICLLRSH